MSSHNPRDLYAKPLGDGFALYDEVEQNPIATARDEGNARRLVACWNYCQGINTLDLERGTIGALMDSVRDRASRASRERERIVWSALDDMVHCFDVSDSPDHNDYDAWVKARDVRDASKP